MKPLTSLKVNRKTILSRYAIYMVLFVMVVVLSIGTSSFLTTRNILNVLRQISMNAILAFGMTYVIISDGIDLSVGSTIALAGVLAANFAHRASTLIVPIAVALGVGLLVGLINGVIIAYTGIPAFIVTLGMCQIARGAAFLYTDGFSVINLGSSFKFIGQGTLLGIPFPVYLLLFCGILTYLFLHRTKFGRHIYAVGGNENAARVSGINVQKTRILVYTICGLCAGIVSLILTARTNSANPNAADGYELDAIAAAVIGGTSMSGGKGLILETITGALIIGIMNNGLDLFNISSYAQQVVKGAIIIGAVLIDRINEKKK